MMGFGMGFNNTWMIVFWIVIIGAEIWALAAPYPSANSNPPTILDDDALTIL